ncbi:MAG: hydrogenase maturation nickel metallochaperone HypA [Acidobacteria bacterium]|nr:hydrogenase maturation nickel metallochaperone HypA [Acidobacteriota bacterium]
MAKKLPTEDVSARSDEVPDRRCPSCGASLPVQGVRACPRCGSGAAGRIARGRRLAAYALSLPERLSRIAVGSAAGLVKGATDLLLPESIRCTKLYQVLLQKNLRFLIQQVGAVSDVYPQGTSVPPDYVARKFVGNFIELTGILTMRASPVWILALLADLSGGTQVFLREFVSELQRQGLLSRDSRIDNIDQLLEALQAVAGNAADRLDTPPLSVRELRQTLETLREEANALKLKNRIRPADLDSVYRDLVDVAEKQGRTLYEVSTAVALGTVNRLGRTGRQAVTGLRVAHALLDQEILSFYGRALRDISRDGYYRYLARATKPYFRAMRHHLARKTDTWTERYFLSRVTGGGMSSRR